MGHSDFSTTANIYTHLDVNSKLTIDPGDGRRIEMAKFEPHRHKNT
jgi:hypothetical protein